MQDLDHNTPRGHHTDSGPTGLGQYGGLGEYCQIVALILPLRCFLC